MKAFKNLLHTAVMGIGACVVILGILVDLVGMFTTGMIANSKQSIIPYMHWYLGATVFVFIAALISRFVMDNDHDRKWMPVFLISLSPIVSIATIILLVLAVVIIIVSACFFGLFSETFYFPRFIGQVLRYPK